MRPCTIWRHPAGNDWPRIELWSEATFLQKLGMVRPDAAGDVRPTVAGILMATADPRPWLPNAFIQAVAYLGDSIAPETDRPCRLDFIDCIGPLDKAKCPIPDLDWLKTSRRTMMDRRGEGVGIILEQSERLSGRRPEYRLIDDAELLLTIWAAAPVIGDQ